MENYSDKELIIGLQQDKVEAFDALYWRYHKRLYSNIFKLLKNADSSHDILQEVFIALWEKRFSLDPNKEVSGWLFTVSYNKSINHLKMVLRENVLFDELDEGLHISVQTRNGFEEEQLQIIEKAVLQLSPQKRKVFDLCKFQGKTYDETAKELNISKHTVKEYLSGAVKNVKEYVKLNAQTNISFLYWLCLEQFFN